MAGKKNNDNKIILEFGGRYRLLLTNPRQVMGHDDSLPFNTEFTLYDGGNEMCAGSAWNDGWGGDSMIRFTTGQLTAEVKDYISKNFYWYFIDHNYHFSFELVVELLVCVYLDLHAFHGKTMTEEQFKEYIKH